LGEELTVGIAVGRFESSALRVAFETSEFLLLVLSAITGVGVVLAIVVVVCSGVRSRRALAARPTFAFGSGVVDGGGNRREDFTGFFEVLFRNVLEKIGSVVSAKNAESWVEIQGVLEASEVEEEVARFGVQGDAPLLEVSDSAGFTEIVGDAETVEDSEMERETEVEVFEVVLDERVLVRVVAEESDASGGSGGDERELNEGDGEDGVLDLGVTRDGVASDVAGTSLDFWFARRSVGGDAGSDICGRVGFNLALEGGLDSCDVVVVDFKARSDGREDLDDMFLDGAREVVEAGLCRHLLNETVRFVGLLTSRETEKEIVDGVTARDQDEAVVH
jgi:hypothetical protein